MYNSSITNFQELFKRGLNTKSGLVCMEQVATFFKSGFNWCNQHAGQSIQLVSTIIKYFPRIVLVCLSMLLKLCSNVSGIDVSYYTSTTWFTYFPAFKSLITVISSGSTRHLALISLCHTRLMTRYQDSCNYQSWFLDRLFPA